MNIPIHHLSVRVPWHDAKWNGKVCCNPRENGSCMFLPRINESKDVDAEEALADKWLHELPANQLPPCVGEKVHFMSPHNIYKKVSHPYSENDGNKDYYGHYKETTYCYPAHSFSVIPYNWMLKDSKTEESAKAKELQISYFPNKEPNLSFGNTWVQESENQKTILNTFIKPIIEGSSLVFIYAKNIPNIENTSRILIGVGHISKIGKLTEYNYDKNQPIPFRSMLWERPIYHTIREDFANGFLLPYHEFFKFAENDDSINIPDYIAFAPSFEEFSFGSEWVSNDSAIESLLILEEKLKKFQEILPDKNYSKQLKWIDNELSKLWKMRGPFPGLGAVLSGLKIEEGNLIAWELDQIIRNKETGEVEENPWDYVNLLFNGENSFLPKELQTHIDETLRGTWDNYSKYEKDFLELLSRMRVNNEQVNEVIDSKEREQVSFLENPYSLFEKSRHNSIIFSISAIDKAVFPDNKILIEFPLPKIVTIKTPLDKRRVRGLCVDILEQEAIDGNTLITDSQLVTKLDSLPLQPLCNPSIRNLSAIEDFLEEEIVKHLLDDENEIHYFKLKRYEEIKNKIKKTIQKRTRRSITPEIKHDWLDIINQKFGAIDSKKPSWYQEKDKQARNEKSIALDILSNNRVSILIGPAGTGKTTLLEIFCNLDFIKRGTLLKLAPTGKARVKLGNDAQTLAQFLIQRQRYNPETGLFYMNSKGEQEKYDTVIIDEASMLTEDQLSALLDSLTGVERLILVGDYRQLPPIGAGRPFVDIHQYLKQKKKGIAELKVLFRQLAESELSEEESLRLDVRLGKWFSDDEIKKQDIDIFKEIESNSSKNWKNIRFIEWFNVKHLNEILIHTLNEEIETLLKIEEKEVGSAQYNFDSSLGAIFPYGNNKWTGFNIDSAKEVEKWQILSPTRTSGYGTKVLNKKIQKEYREEVIEKSIFPGTYTNKSGEERHKARKMPKPISEDGVVYGDKIINLRNVRRNKPWHNYYSEKDGLSEDKVLKYIANGEIGIHVGKYGSWNFGSESPINIAFSSQEDYSYVFKSREFQEDGKVNIELGYSITIHKSQGSGFKFVFFILPNPCPLLSRELFYTALTRQEERIIILHQGQFSDFRKFTTGEYSETGRRLTDLFSEPKLKLVNKKYYDTNYIQVSAKGEFLISKSEVIIADQLFYKRISYAYEAAISDDKGITIHPDFTVEDEDLGITYYWEHLGLLIKDDYRSKWVRKKEWYVRNGIIEYTENSDADKQLIITRDKPDGGIDAHEIREIIEDLFE